MTDPARVAAILLAAGRGTRFGSTKQLALVDGRPLVRVSAESLLESAIDDVVAVLGHDAARVREALGGLPIRTVVNERFADGMASSIVSGVAALDANVAAALIALGDQPVPERVVTPLIERWRAGGCDIVAPVYDGVRGNPVLFGATHFPDLMRLSGDHGARELVDAAAGRLALVGFDFATPPDVDRPADVEALRRAPAAPSAEARQADRSRPL